MNARHDPPPRSLIVFNVGSSSLKFQLFAFDGVRVGETLAQGRFERQAAKDLVDPLLHLLHPPPRPRPELRRHIIDDGNPLPMRPLGEGPVEAGVVDEDDRVGLLVAEVVLGLFRERKKLVQVDSRFP